MPNYILPLDSPGATLDSAGGKGANLSALLRAGFSVPRGFIITTGAYDAFVAANRIASHITEALVSIHDEAARYETASQVIRRSFEEAAVPDKLAGQISDAYRALGSPAVAVRSSATAEDLPEASFAGQQETYLNVCGEPSVLSAVRRCWSSLWTARAIAYRAKQRIPPGVARLAVVVQQMVPAEAAGVLFTVDPVTGDPEQVVIEAAWGLGETVVGGRVSPDTMAVDKATGRLLRVDPGEKAIMSVPVATGTREVEVDPGHRSQQVLSAQQAAELTRLGREIEAHFARPQDIEWAISGGRIAILQARPVTVARKPKAQDGREWPIPPGDDDWPAYDEHPPQPFDFWTRANLAENFPDPELPFHWSTMPSVLRHMFLVDQPERPYLLSIQWCKRFCGRSYINEGAIGHVWNREFGLSGSALESMLGASMGGQMRSVLPFRPLPFLRGLPRLIRTFTHNALPELLALYDRIDTSVVESETIGLETLSDRELWDLLTRWGKMMLEGAVVFMRMTSQAQISVALLEQFLKRNGLYSPGLTLDLVTGVSGVFMAEIGPALFGLAEELRERGLDGMVLAEPGAKALSELRRTPDAQTFLTQLSAFLKRHGHRCVNESDWRYPRWAEAPELVIDLLAGYLRAGDAVNPAETEKRQRERRERATADIERKLDPLRTTLFRRQLAAAQTGVRQRDNTRYYNTKMMLAVRRVIVQLGRRWVERGWLRAPDDFLFLADQEIGQLVSAGEPAGAGLDLIPLVAGRRTAFSFWFGVREPEAIDWQGRPAPLPERAAGSVLRGIGASPGQARGPARVVTDPSQALMLKPGDILVTRATDPGWTPVFPLIAGLVLEIGGHLSHGAIVAREYGVPAVVNVKGAMERIREGQIVRLDGCSGQVQLSSTFSQMPAREQPPAIK